MPEALIRMVQNVRNFVPYIRRGSPLTTVSKKELLLFFDWGKRSTRSDPVKLRIPLLTEFLTPSGPVPCVHLVEPADGQCGGLKAC